MTNRKFVFAVGHVTSGAFAGYNSEAWCYLYADTPEEAWYAAKKRWDMTFPLADFRLATERAAAKQYPFPEGAPSRCGVFVQAKQEDVG